MTIVEAFEMELNLKLNNIIADIENLPIYAAKFKDSMSICIDKESVLNIINKYKADTEVKDADNKRTQINDSTAVKKNRME